MSSAAETPAQPDLTDRRVRLKYKMAEARQELVDVLNSLTEEQLTLPTDNEGWTVYDVARHIAGAEGGMYAIAERILAGVTGPNPDFDINRYNAGGIRKRQGKAIPDLIEELNQSRVRTLQLLDSVTEEQLDMNGYHPTVGPVTLYGLMVVIYRHERDHAQDIKKAIAASS